MPAWSKCYSVFDGILTELAQDYLHGKFVCGIWGSNSCIACPQSEKTGWLVGCNYQGRNGFGGMVRKANWFTIQRSQVVKVEPGNAYSLKP